MKKIAITGSSGFIGSNLREHFQDKFQVATMDKVGYPTVKQDLRKSWPITVRSDALVHLASISNVVVAPGEELLMINHNMQLAMEALVWCVAMGVPFMIHASSSAVYGDRNAPPYEESAECLPLGAYGQSKLDSERWFSRCAERYGVKVLSLRFFNAIGDYQKKTMLPWLLLEAARTNTPLTIFGECWRSWTAVDDVCAVITEALTDPDRFPPGHTVVNLGLDNPLSQLELIKMFERRGDLKVPTVMGARRPFEMEKTQPDSRLFNQYFTHKLTHEALDKAVDDVLAYHSLFMREPE